MTTQSNWNRALGGDRVKSDRLRLLIGTIERQAEGFDMKFYANSCGTPGCIAGHAAHLAGVDLDTCSGATVHNNARAWLGLSEEQAGALFKPIGVEANYCAREEHYNFVTKRHALAVLRHFAATGKVDWEKR